MACLSIFFIFFCSAFIFHLDREIEKVNGFFVYKRSELERRLRILSEKSRRASTSTATTPITNGKHDPLALTKGLNISVPPSPFMSDPEVDAECLQALLDTKTMLLKLSWFAEMNRRAVEKILKK